MRDRTPLVLFAAAAGPRLGFGHLVRAGVLADALGVSRQLVLRGSESTLHAALRLGWTVHQGPRLLDHLQPDLLIVDDPSRVHVSRWIRLARRQQIPVATMHDGDSTWVNADLVIDGSVTARAGAGPNHLTGPSFSVLRQLAGARRPSKAVARAPRVLVALGGGAHVRRCGVAIAAAISGAVPGVQVDVAAGFALDGHRPELPQGCRWITAPHGLGPRLADADVAVVAGGVTLYEACALGTPTVAVPVVPAQRAAIRAAAAAGAVVGVAARYEHHVPVEIAAAVSAILAAPALASDLSRRGRRLVDGHGTERVVTRLRGLVAPQRAWRWRHAA